MTRKCYFCGMIMGEKEPLEVKSVTGGECTICHLLWKDWYSLWREGGMRETATVYILRRRAEMGLKDEGGDVNGRLGNGTPREGENGEKGVGD